jgi:hypothetical protein
MELQRFVVNKKRGIVMKYKIYLVMICGWPTACMATSLPGDTAVLSEISTTEMPSGINFKPCPDAGLGTSTDSFDESSFNHGTPATKTNLPESPSISESDFFFVEDCKDVPVEPAAPSPVDSEVDFETSNLEASQDSVLCDNDDSETSGTECISIELDSPPENSDPDSGFSSDPDSGLDSGFGSDPDSDSGFGSDPDSDSGLDSGFGSDPDSDSGFGSDPDSGLDVEVIKADDIPDDTPEVPVENESDLQIDGSESGAFFTWGTISEPEAEFEEELEDRTYGKSNEGQGVASLSLTPGNNITPNTVNKTINNTINNTWTETIMSKSGPINTTTPFKKNNSNNENFIETVLGDIGESIDKFGKNIFNRFFG